MVQSRNRLVLNLGDVKIDADPLQIARLIHDLVNKKAFRRVFEADPVGALREAGIKVPEEYAERITPAAIDKGLAQFKERADVEARFAPGVGVAVGVHTDPAVAVGVNAGVQSAVVTAVIAREADPVAAAEARRAARVKALRKSAKPR